MQFDTRFYYFLSLFMLLVVCLPSCDKPSDPDYSNKYDDRGRSFIPTTALITFKASQVTAKEAWLGGSFENTYGPSVTKKGVCWSTSAGPTINTNCTDQGTGHTQFSSKLEPLAPGTAYFIRAYAVHEGGAVVYGNQEQFATLAPPNVTTSAVTQVGTTTATAGGNVTNQGSTAVTVRGVCWSTQPNPATLNTCTASGSGMGSFTSNLSGLLLGTTYYVWAYASNSAGSSYGERVTFTTSFGGRDNTTLVVDVVNSKTGRTWMDRNLGASRAATIVNDTQAYGDKYQWGRSSDGHEKRNSTTTSSTSSSNQPTHRSFITTFTNPFDWKNPQNTSLWQGGNGANNPCPEDYRLPTIAEWDAEFLSWISSNSVGAFASSLRLTVSISRDNTNGVVYRAGSVGGYWSSIVSGTGSRYLRFDSGSATTNFANSQRAHGISVRCIKN